MGQTHPPRPITSIDDLKKQINDKKYPIGKLFSDFQNGYSNSKVKEICSTVEVDVSKLEDYADELQASKSYMESLFMHYIVLNKKYEAGMWKLAGTVESMCKVATKLLETVKNPYLYKSLVSNILQKSIRKTLERILCLSDCAEYRLLKVSLCLYCIGTLHSAIMHYSKAIDNYQRGIENMQEMDNPTSYQLYAKLHHEKGLALGKSSQLFAALRCLRFAKSYYTDAIDISEEDKIRMKKSCDKAVKDTLYNFFFNKVPVFLIILLVVISLILLVLSLLFLIIYILYNVIFYPYLIINFFLRNLFILLDLLLKLLFSNLLHIFTVYLIISITNDVQDFVSCFYPQVFC